MGTFCGCQKTEVKKIKIQKFEVTKLKHFHNESVFETAKMISHTRSIYHILNLILVIEAIKRDSLTDYALTDNEYKYNMGAGYVFFEIMQPEEISYTYKLNPAAFSVPWNET